MTRSQGQRRSRGQRIQGHHDADLFLQGLGMVVPQRSTQKGRKCRFKKKTQKYWEKIVTISTHNINEGLLNTMVVIYCTLFYLLNKKLVVMTLQNFLRN